MKPCLFIADLDGTLVEDHLIDVECDLCRGRGAVSKGGAFGGTTLPELYGETCGDCKGRGKRLVPRGDRHYTSTVPVEGAVRRVRELREAGTAFAIATNQGGVALGFQVESEVNQRIASAVTAFDWFASEPSSGVGGAFSVHVSFDHPDAKVERYLNPTPEQLWRRKPGAGMLEEAMQVHGYPPEATVYVGDRKTDEEAAALAEVRFIYAEDWIAGGIAELDRA